MTDLSTTAGNAVSDLSGVVAGADVLASQFVDVKNALQDLQDFAVALRDNYAYTPTGVVVPFAGASTDTPPAGWFVCNGASFVSVGLSAGAKLYDLLTGAGWSALPDLQGRTIIGVGSAVSGATLTGTLGGVQGVNGGTTTLTSAHIPEHYHDLQNHTHGGTTNGESNGHVHGFNDTYTTFSSAGPQLGTGTTYSRFNFAYAIEADTTAGNNVGHTHTFGTGGPSTNNSGNYGTASPTAVSAVQPSLALNYLIKG